MGLICLHSGIINSMFIVCLCFLGRGFDHEGDLKPDGQEILLMALTSLEDAMCTLKDGTIQCQLLMLIRDNLDRFLELSQEINKEGNEKAVLRQCLDQRLAELRAFEVERDQVVGLIGMCTLIKGGNSFITGFRVAPLLFYKICNILASFARKMLFGGGGGTVV